MTTFLLYIHHNVYNIIDRLIEKYDNESWGMDLFVHVLFRTLMLNNLICIT